MAPFDPPSLDRLVIYELHVGTFTPEGTFAAAARHFGELASLGVSAIEVMPVAEFPGRRGWGYDGVYLSAAHSAYGGPGGLAELVSVAHENGLAVILDVVYNHVGASGVDALEAFGPYFTDAHRTPWGQAINYEQPAVREWVLQSAEGWIRDFGIDGLRLDAIHAIFDASEEHIAEAIVRRVHAIDAHALVIGEIGMDDPQMHGARACDAIWIDDFHHALHVLLTGERDGYYRPFGHVRQLADAFRHEPPEHFVVYGQNHDQVGNRAYGERLPAPALELAAFCTVLSPFVPLLFMGEEYGESSPFQFFSDHIDERIARATREGRRREFADFTRFGEELPDPQDVATFERSKLRRERDGATADLYRDLLSARRLLEPGKPDEISFDEEARWLRVRRGAFEIMLSFAARAQVVPCRGGRIVELATGEGALARDGGVELPPMSGALVR